MQNVKTTTRAIPSTYTPCQYKLLCRLIKQNKVSKQFFYFLLSQIYDLSDWKQLNYQQMYQLIHVLTFYDYKGPWYKHNSVIDYYLQP